MKRNLLLLLSIFLVFELFGQKAITVKGTISDETGEILPGVNIVVKGTVNGTASNIDGQYELKILEDNPTLIFSFIGYKTQEIAVNGQKQIDVILSFDTENLEEVVITAQAKGQKNAIREQINSNTIKNVVASDRLQENPDANAVEAIGRLPGISVQRAGGEGAGLVIRGLEPKYSSVTLNGVQMPSTGGESRETNISGISQYVLQGVEVYKALTADMEANSVAGTVNLKLRETPKGLHYDVMAQMGYNDMNNYWGNYKLQGDFSDRFLNDKLGVFFSANAERVNRSTQTMSAGYGIEAANKIDILLNNANLNNIESIRYRRSAMLSLDYKLNSSTKLSLYTLYSNAKNDQNNQAKSYTTTGIGGVGYNFSYNPYRKNDMVQSAISGITNLNFLNMEINYGVAYSMSVVDDPKSRSWNYNYQKVPTDAVFSQELRRSDPSEVIPLFNDDGTHLQDLQLQSIGQSSDNISDKNLTAYLDFTIPFKIGIITGNVKTGGTYRQKNRVRDVISGSQAIVTNQFAKPIIADSLDWIKQDPLTGALTAEGMQDGAINKFLNGQYNFGTTFSFDKLNQITDAWQNTSDYWYAQGQEVWSQYFPKEKLGFTQNIAASMINDQDIVEDYYAAYFMAEINIGKWVMMLPGVRYEETNTSMQGFEALQPTISAPVYEPLPGSARSAERDDKFWLPMVHLRVTPLKSFYAHLAYTQTLSRPHFNDISPNTWINTGFQPFAYSTQNPALKAEQWENYDAQLTLHGDKVGLISVTGFYKTVQDKIWTRNFKRIKGDPIIEPFPDASVVDVTRPENHQEKIYVKGVEFEVQTSFWYLPKPFSFFTATANYTFTQSETKYPLSWIKNIIPPQGGRPVPTRIDSIATGPMLFQPKHIINASLGFNREGLNVWLSFQYNGEIFTGKNYQLEELDPLKEKFYRWDIQVSQKLKGKLKGFEIVGNFANLTDFMEKSRLRGDERPTYLENYGWTAELGVRYRF